MALTNSGRRLLKATYAPIEFDQPPDKLSQAHLKAALVRGLQLQAGEVDTIRRTVAGTGTAPIPDSAWSLLEQFEPQPVAALVPKASVLADIPAEYLQTFAHATLDHRTDQLRSLDEPSTPPSISSASRTSRSIRRFSSATPWRPVPRPSTNSTAASTANYGSGP